jgi:hypothetical protein
MGSARIELEETRTTPAALRRHERNATVLVRHQPEVACGTVTRSGEADLTVVTALSGIEHNGYAKAVARASLRKAILWRVSLVQSAFVQPASGFSWTR